MKLSPLKITVFLCSVLIITACNNTTPKSSETDGTPQKQEVSKNLKRYGVESGSITYTITGSQTGTKTISWRDWGMTERTDKDTTLSVGNITIPSKEVTIMKGEWIYTYDPDKKTGTKISNNILSQISKNANNPDLGEVGLDILNSTGTKKSGSQTIAGKSCDMYEIISLGTKTCIWKAINLLNETSIVGTTIKEEATQVSTGTPDKDLFEVPEDIEFQNLGDVGNILKNL